MWSRDLGLYNASYTVIQSENKRTIMSNRSYNEFFTDHIHVEFLSYFMEVSICSFHHSFRMSLYRTIQALEDESWEPQLEEQYGNDKIYIWTCSNAYVGDY